jgi:hypothetical protein
MSGLAFATHSFTPITFRPPLERAATVILGIAAGLLWPGVVPAELALALS